MKKPDLLEKLKKIACSYPSELVSEQLKSIPRIFFNIELALQASKTPYQDLEICDLGGGIGLFSPGCAAYGMKRSVLVDDFDDDVNRTYGMSVLDLHKDVGVQVFSRDVVANGIADITGNFDIITTFDSMEHWHASPKTLFKQVMSKLKPGGIFVLGVPNCVNMRKRITVPFGMGKWSTMQEWYETDKFRGHVREPDVSDFYYIAKDMGLSSLSIYGRNWQGYYSTNSAIRLATKIADYPLRLKPSLCPDITWLAIS